MFKQLLQLYIDLFQKEGEIVLTSICNCSVPSSVVLKAYEKLIPIEGLAEKEKKELWLYAKEKYPDGDNETRIRFSKIVHTIGTLI